MKTRRKKLIARCNSILNKQSEAEAENFILAVVPMLAKDDPTIQSGLSAYPPGAFPGCKADYLGDVAKIKEKLEIEVTKVDPNESFAAKHPWITALIVGLILMFSIWQIGINFIEDGFRSLFGFQTNESTEDTTDVPTPEATYTPTMEPTASPTELPTNTPDPTQPPDPADNSLYGLLALQDSGLLETINTCPVYTGPGYEYYRRGAAQVNKGRKARIYGKSSDGWIFVRYQNDDLEEFIYGWVEGKAFNKTHLRKYNELIFSRKRLVTIKPTIMRDGTSEYTFELETLDAGAVVVGLATYRDDVSDDLYIYCELQKQNGQKARGFIPEDAFFEK